MAPFTTPARPVVFLVGYRGAGKTAVGRALAARLGWAFHDADAELESQVGATVADLFAAEGEAGFRDREAAVLADLVTRPRVVIATGGGVVLRSANRDVLRTGFVVWLTASAETLWGRIRSDPLSTARRPKPDRDRRTP